MRTMCTMPNTNKWKPERVIFRIEHDPYMKIDKVLAVFPDDEANPGRVGCVPMWFDGNGTAWFDNYCESTIQYYWSTKPLKDKELAEKCKNALEARYGGQFRVMQKIMWR